MDPAATSHRSHLVYHLVSYGRALTHLRGRHDDAVRVLRRAEQLSPHRVQRDPFIRDALAVLMQRTQRNGTTAATLRSMAHRAGLPV